jgi:uncharacterized protein YrzB (UPF0473 family)
MQDDNLITITIDDEEKVAEILFTHHDEDNDKTYVVFRFMDSEEISAAVYHEETDTEGYFEDIETEQEWELLDEILSDYFDESEEYYVEEEDEDEENI